MCYHSTSEVELVLASEQASKAKAPSQGLKHRGKQKVGLSANLPLMLPRMRRCKWVETLRYATPARRAHNCSMSLQRQLSADNTPSSTTQLGVSYCTLVDTHPTAAPQQTSPSPGKSFIPCQRPSHVNRASGQSLVQPKIQEPQKPFSTHACTPSTAHLHK